MVRRKADAAKQHVIDFTDHAGRPAKMTWLSQPEEVLPPLLNICLYFVHPNFDLDGLDLAYLRRDIRNGDGDPVRFELFCIPEGSNADCAQHYREELEARGEDSEQVREVERAEKDSEYAAVREPRGRLPGLASSQRHEGGMAYHRFVWVYKDPTYSHDDDDKGFD
ncbi:hypothetical protein ACLX1H_008170 [Fusarium chlamydosporum]